MQEIIATDKNDGTNEKTFQIIQDNDFVQCEYLDGIKLIEHLGHEHGIFRIDPIQFLSHLIEKELIYK
jgi:hypothetical protein